MKNKTWNEIWRAIEYKAHSIVCNAARCGINTIKIQLDSIKEDINDLDEMSLNALYLKYNVSIVEYTDMLKNELSNEEPNIEKIKSIASAICKIASDAVYVNLHNNEYYKE